MAIKMIEPIWIIQYNIGVNLFFYPNIQYKLVIVAQL